MSARISKFHRRVSRIRRNVILATGAVVLLAVLLPARNYPDLSTNAVAILRGGDAWNGASDRRSSRDLLSSVPASPGTILSGPVNHVSDGDTVVVGHTPIRIANLDCAEAGTQAGNNATAFAQQMLLHRSLTCRLAGERSHDREVGRCALPDGRDFGDLMVSGGFCRRWQ